MSGICKNFDILDFMGSKLRHFPTEVSFNKNLFEKAYWMKSLLNVFNILTPKHSKNGQTLHEILKILKIFEFRLVWSHSEVCLKQIAARVSKKGTS